MYYHNVITLATNIKRHFDRHAVINGVRTSEIRLTPLPYDMPKQLTSIRATSCFKYFNDQENDMVNEEGLRTTRESLPSGIFSLESIEHAKVLSPTSISDTSIATLSPDKRKQRVSKKRNLYSPDVDAKICRNLRQKLNSDTIDTSWYFQPISPTLEHQSPKAKTKSLCHTRKYKDVKVVPQLCSPLPLQPTNIDSYDNAMRYSGLSCLHSSDPGKNISNLTSHYSYNYS